MVGVGGYVCVEGVGWRRVVAMTMPGRAGPYGALRGAARGAAGRHGDLASSSCRFLAG